MAIRKEQKKGSSIIYLIDEENRTVVAKIPTKNAIKNVYDDCAKQDIVPYGVYDKSFTNPYFIGKAVCAPTDEFDIEFGKKLACARALKKFYKFKFRCFRDIAEEYNKQFNAIEDFMNYSWLAGNRFADESNRLAMNGKDE